VRWENGKNKGKSKAIIQSFRPSGFAPAFGRAVARFALAFCGTPEGVPCRFWLAQGVPFRSGLAQKDKATADPYGMTTRKSNGNSNSNSKNNSNSNCRSRSRSNSRSSFFGEG
jgi:hypothetical protein